jgi:hypothetical protein
MGKKALLGLAVLALLGYGGTGRAEQAYTWVQVVEHGMPDVNNREVAQEAFIENTPPQPVLSVRDRRGVRIRKA